MQANLDPMFERKAKISCNGGSVTKNLRVRQDYMRTSQKTDFLQKNGTSARLKITFVDMTYPGQRLELPSLCHHFLLLKSHVLLYRLGYYLPTWERIRKERKENLASLSGTQGGHSVTSGSVAEWQRYRRGHGSKPIQT